MQHAGPQYIESAFTAVCAFRYFYIYEDKMPVAYDLSLNELKILLSKTKDTKKFIRFALTEESKLAPKKFGTGR